MSAVEVVAEEVAANLEEVASVTRKINPSGISYLLGGLVIGGTIGFYFGRKISKAKLRAEVFAEAEEEIAEVRAHYQAKVVAAEPKPDPKKLVSELGYSVRDDMGIPMPKPTRERPLPAPVPIKEIDIDLYDGGEGYVKIHKNKDAGWNYAKELDSRTPNAPYVIHQDEHKSSEFEYVQVSYIYYDADDVLIDLDDNRPITNASLVVGENNLKWGHGSDDEDVVFIRNDRLELDIQITRSPKSYEEEVLGLENDNTT
jgi:hypothetical protein